MKNLLFILLAIFVFGCTAHKATWTPMQSKSLPGVLAVVEKRVNPYYWDELKLPSRPFEGYFERYRTKCTGVLVRPDAVITAEHCVDDLETYKVGIIYGCSDVYMDSNCKTSSVRLIVRNSSADIALLLLNNQLKGIKVVPISTSRPKEGQYLLIAGFGRKGMLVAEFAQVWTGSPLSYVTDYRFKTKPEKGDSGGPAYIINGNKLLVSGITSEFKKVHKASGKDYFSGFVHVDLSYHKKWIDQQYYRFNTVALRE